MSLGDWLRGWRSQASVASSPSAFDKLLAELDRPKPGEQRFIPISEMSDQDWELARFSDPQPQPRPSLIGAAPDQNSFPMP